MDKYSIQIKPGYVNNSEGTSIYNIIIEPKLYRITVSQSYTNVDIPVAHLRNTAATKLASTIVNNLTYDKCEDPRTGGVQHIFSVKDYTITEREQSKQIISGLELDLKHLQRDYADLCNKHSNLKRIYTYNSRSVLIKLIDWLLYAKPFNKETTCLN